MWNSVFLLLLRMFQLWDHPGPFWAIKTCTWWRWVRKIKDERQIWMYPTTEQPNTGNNRPVCKVVDSWRKKTRLDEHVDCFWLMQQKKAHAARRRETSPGYHHCLININSPSIIPLSPGQYSPWTCLWWPLCARYCHQYQSAMVYSFLS